MILPVFGFVGKPEPGASRALSIKEICVSAGMRCVDERRGPKQGDFGHGA